MKKALSLLTLALFLTGGAMFAQTNTDTKTSTKTKNGTTTTTTVTKKHKKKKVAGKVITKDDKKVEVTKVPVEKKAPAKK